MGKQRLLAFFVVLAALAGAWLATVGTRPGRGQSTGPVDTLPGAGEAAEEALAALPLPSSGTRRAEDAPRVAPKAGLPASPATLALRLVARGTKAPLRGVNVRLARDLSKDVVYLSSSRGDEARSPRSDADGRVEFEARPWEDFTLQIDPLGAAHVRKESFLVPPLEPGQRLEVELEVMVRDDLRWFGRVLDDETEAPLSGARVEWDESWPVAEPAPSVSGADGLLVVEFASWRKSSVRIVHEDYQEAPVALAPGHETPELAEAVRLVRPASLAVRVLDGFGVPLREVAVEVRFDPEPGSAGGPESELFEALEFPATVLRNGVMTQLPAPHLWRPATTPPAGKRLQGLTDANGTCAFDGLPPGVDGEVLARRPGEPAQRQDLRLVPGEAHELVFEFGSVCSVRGRVEDEDGKPLAGLDLWRLAGEALPGYLDSGHESAAVDKLRTDAEGRFTFPSVPAGAWWIGAAPYESRGGASVPLTTRIVAAPGERVRELVLTCPAARYIRGRVLSETGEPLRAQVTASREGSSVSAAADTRGNFGLGPLPAGAWDLEAAELPDALGSPPGTPLRARSVPVRAYAGETDVELRLRAGGGLSGIVLDAGGRPARGAVVEAYSAQDGSMQRATCGEQGAFRFEGLAGGSHRLLARSAETVRALGPVHVEPGRWSPPLELRLAPGVVLRLQLDAERTADRARAHGRGSAGGRPAWSDRSRAHARVEPEAGVVAAANGARRGRRGGSGRVRPRRGAEVSDRSRESVQVVRGGIVVGLLRVRGAKSTGPRSRRGSEVTGPVAPVQSSSQAPRGPRRAAPLHADEFPTLSAATPPILLPLRGAREARLFSVHPARPRAERPAGPRPG